MVKMQSIIPSVVAFQNTRDGRLAIYETRKSDERKHYVTPCAVIIGEDRCQHGSGLDDLLSVHLGRGDDPFLGYVAVEDEQELESIWGQRGWESVAHVRAINGGPGFEIVLRVERMQEAAQIYFNIIPPTMLTGGE